MTDEVRALLHGKHLLLVDFDGPICSLYNGTGADTVAAALKRRVRATEVQQKLTDTNDPLQVLRVASILDPDQAVAVERDLIAFELEAAESASPTQGVDAFIVAARRSGSGVGIVSNNSEEAIRRYLDRAGIGHCLDPIVGRPPGSPKDMKPAPAELLRACAQIDVRAHEAAFIGDSVSTSLQLMRPTCRASGTPTSPASTLA